MKKTTETRTHTIIELDESDVAQLYAWIQRIQINASHLNSPIAARLKNLLASTEPKPALICQQVFCGNRSTLPDGSEIRCEPFFNHDFNHKNGAWFWGD